MRKTLWGGGVPPFPPPPPVVRPRVKRWTGLYLSVFRRINVPRIHARLTTTVRMDSVIKAIVVSATRDILERHVTNVRKGFLRLLCSRGAHGWIITEFALASKNMTEKKKGKEFEFYRFLELNFGSRLDCMYCLIYGNLDSRIRVVEFRIRDFSFKAEYPRNSAYHDWNPELKIPFEGIWNPGQWIRKPRRGIKNPRLSWAPFTLELERALKAVKSKSLSTCFLFKKAVYCIFIDRKVA